MTKKLFIFLLPVLLALSCHKPGCFENSGPMVKTTRPTSTFHQINVTDNVNVILTQDTTEAIVVEAGQHLQPNIVTTIEKGILTISNLTTCNWLRAPGTNINVYLSVKKLDKINYNGSGNITTTNTIIADSLILYSMDGAGNLEMNLEAQYTVTHIQDENADFILHGKSDYCWSYTNSRGSTDLQDFEVKRLNFNYAGVRNTVVHATELLEVTIFHTGNVYYKAAPPVIIKNFLSSGRLYKLP